LDANLEGATLRRALLADCDFRGACLENADLRGANLRGANLSRQNLRTARLAGAMMEKANLCGADLEYIDWPEARLAAAHMSGAYLTGSRLVRADLRGAKLDGTGLAEIEWDDADLRSADLRGCSFHMGSSRSGLVDSPYPCHGSRTGFYTNDYEERSYKSPEQIRKASLCGADLRDALIKGVDFYLVDLRGAKYDTQQERHFRRCNAILENYVP
jgi:uncharacterized protein YjbI with pentapeptide repeats